MRKADSAHNLDHDSESLDEGKFASRSRYERKLVSRFSNYYVKTNDFEMTFMRRKDSMQEPESKILRMIFGTAEGNRRSGGAALCSRDRRKSFSGFFQVVTGLRVASNAILRMTQQRNWCFALSAEDSTVSATVALARIGMMHLSNSIGEYQFRRNSSASTAAGRYRKVGKRVALNAI
jgi:hypothetical protein